MIHQPLSDSISSGIASLTAAKSSVRDCGGAGVGVDIVDGCTTYKEI